MRSAGPASLNLLPSETHPAWSGLRDLAFRLGTEAAGLAGRLAPGTATAVGALVRGMNCYYSNLIEGHDTRPIDIERALRSEYAGDPQRRDLQREAAAHIAVQASIDGDELGPLRPTPLAIELHRRFYDLLPPGLAQVEEIGTGRMVTVRPGVLRQEEVRVGYHRPPSVAELPSYLHRFDESVPDRLGGAERLVAIAAAHHRLLWIHPFPDGNGRVARLMSHALLRRAGVGSPCWSLARGLARHVAAYRAFLSRADDPPQTMSDGRGLLSDGRLAEFCQFFLAAGLDQVWFMHGLLSPEALGARVREFVAAEAAGDRLDARVAAPLEHAVLFGQVQRGLLPTLLGVSDRQARRLVRPLLDRGLLVGSKDEPLRIGFPLGETERLFPQLWAPAGVAMRADPALEEALRPPRAR